VEEWLRVVVCKEAPWRWTPVQLQVLSEPRSVKIVNELMYYCPLFVDNQPALYTLLVLSACVRSSILIFPQHSPILPFGLSLTKFVLDFVLAEDHLAPSLADAHAGAGAGSAPPPPLLQWWFAQSVRSHVCFSAAPGGVAGMVQITCDKLYRLDRGRRMQERGGQL
jgi:hypothetical protein